MGLVPRTFRGYPLDESGESYRTEEFQALWKLPVWPVATYRISLAQQDQSPALGSEDPRMSKVPMDGIQAAHGLRFTLFVVMLVVFTGALAVVATAQGLFRP